VLVRVWLSRFADPNIATSPVPRCGQIRIIWSLIACRWTFVSTGEPLWSLATLRTHLWAISGYTGIQYWVPGSRRSSSAAARGLPLEDVIAEQLDGLGTVLDPQELVRVAEVLLDGELGEVKALGYLGVRHPLRD
jgi:hypothetical protein